MSTPATTAKKLLSPQQQHAADAVREANAVVGLIANSVQLESLFMVGTSFWVGPRYFEATDPLVKRSFKFDVEVSKVEYDREAGKASALFTWRLYVDLLDPKKTDSERPLQLMATYALSYGNIAGHPENQVSAFVDRVGELASYPYFRAFASQMSWTSGTNLPVLPIISAQRRARRVPHVTKAKPDRPAKVRSRKSSP